MKPLFKVKEVADCFGLTPFTIHRWIRERKLKAVKIGGSVRIRAEELERFIAASEKGAR